MVLSTKPKKQSSIKTKDKRWIYLLNSDLKLTTGPEAARFRKTLSPFQMMARDERKIHHMPETTSSQSPSLF